jgi:hypothetical protein
MTLLKPLTTIALPTLPKFVAREAFTKKNGFYWLGDNFEEHFLPKVEPATKAAIRLSKLTTNSRDEPIRQELGQHSEITLSQLFELLKTADKTEWFIAYVKDIKGEVWAVGCFWRAGDGWSVGAHPLASPYDWDAGCRVFSRDSGNSSSVTSDSQTLEPSDTLPGVNEKLKKVNRIEVIDWTQDADIARAFVKWRDKLTVTLELQDDDRTLKIFLKD